MAVLDPYANRIPPRGYLMSRPGSSWILKQFPSLETKWLGGGQSLQHLVHISHGISAFIE
jgi:hypothetical protein